MEKLPENKVVGDHLEDVKVKMRKEYEDFITGVESKIKEVRDSYYAEVSKLREERDKILSEIDAIDVQKNELIQKNRKLNALDKKKIKLIYKYNGLTDKIIEINHTIDNISNVESLKNEVKQFFDKFGLYVESLDKEIKNAKAKHLKQGKSVSNSTLVSQKKE